jgi:competence protein CoiA
MMYALHNGNRIRAVSGQNAICPQCHMRVIPKCGELVVHHWAHEASFDCDPWWEPETEWHQFWKSLVAPKQVEVTRGKHRADIVRRGVVVELQHSSISPAEIKEREDFYDKMIWFFDGRDIPEDNFDLRGQTDNRYRTFRWKHPRKIYGLCRRPVFIDFGNGSAQPSANGFIFHLKKLYLDGPPYGGWGYRVEHFKEWLIK